MAFLLRASAALLAVLAFNIYAEGHGMRAGASGRHHIDRDRQQPAVAFSCGMPARHGVLHICPRA